MNGSTGPQDDPPYDEPLMADIVEHHSAELVPVGIPLPKPIPAVTHQPDNDVLLFRMSFPHRRGKILTLLLLFFALVLVIGGPLFAIVMLRKAVAAERDAAEARQRELKVTQANDSNSKRAKLAREQANAALKALSQMHQQTKSIAADAPHLAPLQQGLQNVVTQTLNEMPQFDANTEEESAPIAAALQCLGQLYFDSDKFDMAWEQWKKCSDMAGQLSQKGKLLDRGAFLATAYDSFARVQNQIGNSQQAIELLEMAVEIRREHSSRATEQRQAGMQLARTYRHLGSIRAQTGDLRRAVQDLWAAQGAVSRSAASTDDVEAQALWFEILVESADLVLQFRAGEESRDLEALLNYSDSLHAVAARQPYNYELQLRMLEAELRVARWQLMLDVPAQGSSRFEKLYDDVQSLRSRYPESIRAQIIAAQALYGIGLVCRKREQRDKAQEKFQLSLDSWRELKRQLPEDNRITIGMMMSLARCEKFAEAETLIADRSNKMQDGENQCLAAAGFAALAGQLMQPNSGSAKSADDPEVARYVNAAMKSLLEAANRKFHFTKWQRLDPELEVLKGRPDFEALFVQPEPPSNSPAAHL